MARREPDAGIPVPEPVERGDGVALDAEHRVQAALGHGVEHGEGEVSPVEDHDVSGREGVEMRARGDAFVGAGGEDEVDRHAVVEPVEAGQQPLRIVGAVVRERVSGLGEGSRQVQPGAKVRCPFQFGSWVSWARISRHWSHSSAVTVA